MGVTTPLIPGRAELEQAGIRVAVAVPVERTLVSDTLACWWEIAGRGWPLLKLGYNRTDVNRNEAARQFLASSYTHLCMLDSDHLHPPDVVEQLARWVLEEWIEICLLNSSEQIE